MKSLIARRFSGGGGVEEVEALNGPTHFPFISLANTREYTKYIRFGFGIFWGHIFDSALCIEQETSDRWK